MHIRPTVKYLQADKEALFWHKKEGGIECVLCPHRCFLLPDEIGVCRARKNVNGRLMALTYGFPCALQVDSIEKKPLYHFLPSSKTLSLATIGCNLRCLNCQNHHISQANLEPNQEEYISPYDIVELVKVKGCNSISYTYTDPVVYYEYALDTAELARERGLKNVIVSAGYIHKKPLKDWCKVMDAVNIDLKCFDDDVYQRLSQVKLKYVLQTLETLLEENVWLEITNLIIPGYTDDIGMIKDMCKWLVKNGFSKVPIHFSRFHPSYKLLQSTATSIELLQEIYTIAKDLGMEYVYLGNVPQAEYNATYCSNCNSKLIARNRSVIEFREFKKGICSNCGSSIVGVWE
ncbi:AmmeMemoRadiSam system radical SAM enzyme [Labilibacter marinus]|uniref:AmmeMemoRadiSam system radical SAM enzyme n=1 Tax=Labilibacter marinus TaxID=1477105 RepID=UPI000836B758|nr:AmmeMemoRadiSam system radical SAM enzyme [Labilibacter marinus]